VLGICNGFQVLCEAHLLPGALLPNDGLRFICRQVGLVAEAFGGPFGTGIASGDHLSIPVKHMSGRYFAPDSELDRLEAEGRIAFRYAPGENPNGSVRDVAGVVSEGGNVLGLMPHPEHAVDPLTGSDDGLTLFRALDPRITARADARPRVSAA
jgi:phosphoribosylformylglycinamidine synthase